MKSLPLWGALALGVGSFVVLCGAASAGFASQVLRMPAAIRRGVLRVPRAARVTFAAGWVIAWAGDLTAVAANAGHIALGLGVGPIFGALFAGCGDVVLARLTEEWGAQSCPPITFPTQRTSHAATELCAPTVHAAFPKVVHYAESHDARHTVDRLLRRARNVLALLVLPAMLLAPHMPGAAPTGMRPGSGGSDPPSSTVFVVAFGPLALLSLVVATQGIRRATVNRRVSRMAGRRLTVAEVCRAHGWRWSTSPPERSARERWPTIPFFSGGRDYRGLVAIGGAVGAHQLFVIDERGAATSNRERMTRAMRQTVFLLWLPSAELRTLSITGRDVRNPEEQRANHLLESEEFNRRFHVKCDDPRYASGIVTPRMMDHLLTRMPEGTLLAVGGDAIAVVKPGRLRAWELERHVSFLTEAAALLPRYLLNEHSPRPSRRRFEPALPARSGIAPSMDRRNRLGP
jgi:hypothetical protein